MTVELVLQLVVVRRMDTIVERGWCHVDTGDARYSVLFPLGTGKTLVCEMPLTFRVCVTRNKQAHRESFCMAVVEAKNRPCRRSHGHAVIGRRKRIKARRPTSVWMCMCDCDARAHTHQWQRGMGALGPTCVCVFKKSWYSVRHTHTMWFPKPWQGYIYI
jgi:hypothetical protein